jgi:hypothetical protein
VLGMSQQPPSQPPPRPALVCWWIAARMLLGVGVVTGAGCKCRWAAGRGKGPRARALAAVGETACLGVTRFSLFVVLPAPAWPPIVCPLQFVIKRDKTREPVHFDKITARIQHLCEGLEENVDAVRLMARWSQGRGWWWGLRREPVGWCRACAP